MVDADHSVLSRSFSHVRKARVRGRKQALQFGALVHVLLTIQHLFRCFSLHQPPVFVAAVLTCNEAERGQCHHYPRWRFAFRCSKVVCLREGESCLFCPAVVRGAAVEACTSNPPSCHSHASLTARSRLFTSQPSPTLPLQCKPPSLRSRSRKDEGRNPVDARGRASKLQPLQQQSHDEGRNPVDARGRASKLQPLQQHAC
jgi:hypothetical protein